jgi:hypothetical protein
VLEKYIKEVTFVFGSLEELDCGMAQDITSGEKLTSVKFYFYSLYCSFILL